jgi:hypothetical protein
MDAEMQRRMRWVELFLKIKNYSVACGEAFHGQRYVSGSSVSGERHRRPQSPQQEAEVVAGSQGCGQTS